MLLRSAHNNRILRLDQIYLVVGGQQVAQRGHDLVAIVLLADIGQVEGLHRQIVQVLMLGGVVLRNKDRV